MELAKDSWKTTLQAAQHKSAESIIEFGKLMYEYKQTCQIVRGGTSFNRDIKEWLGMSHVIGSRWVKIGKYFDKDVIYELHHHSLPPSVEGICAFIDTPEEFRDEFTSSTTVAKSKSIKENAKVKVEEVRVESLTDEEREAEEEVKREKARIASKKASAVFEEAGFDPFKRFEERLPSGIEHVLNKNDELRKKVIKVMRQHLHPDKDTGDAELFKMLKNYS